MAAKKFLRIGFLALCLAWCGLPPLARAGAPAAPAWWADAATQAAADGYHLISAADLKALLAKNAGRPAGALLIDVRPSYEHAEGHIDHAASLEFHLGHRLKLDDKTRDAFLKLAGPNKNRRIIVYCRSFR